jgi:Tol biopolymer transport system component
MKCKRILFVFICFIVILEIGSAKMEDFPVLKGPYLGQKPPGMIPEIFAPGIVSTDVSEFSCTFSPDGKSFYFSRDRGGYKYSIYLTREEEGGWTNPEVAPFSGEYMDHEPFYSHDGKRLYWGSMRPLNDGKIAYSTWFIEKTDEDWGEPQPLDFFAMYITSSLNGTLYYTVRGEGGTCIARSRCVDGSYQEQEILEPPVFSEYWDAHPFIAPDESYLIFDSENRPKKGECRLWISFQKEDGTWTVPTNMESKIHKKAGYAMLSPDGKYLFFSAGGDIYWVSAKIIEDLRPKELK